MPKSLKKFTPEYKGVVQVRLFDCFRYFLLRSYIRDECKIITHMKMKQTRPNLHNELDDVMAKYKVPSLYMQ